MASELKAHRAKYDITLSGHTIIARDDEAAYAYTCAGVGQEICTAVNSHDALVEMVKAFMNGWTVEKMSLYEEEGIEGWKWTDPNGNEHIAAGAWDELPPWPESAQDSLRGML